MNKQVREFSNSFSFEEKNYTIRIVEHFASYDEKKTFILDSNNNRSLMVFNTNSTFGVEFVYVQSFANATRVIGLDTRIFCKITQQRNEKLYNLAKEITTVCGCLFVISLVDYWVFLFTQTPR